MLFQEVYIEYDTHTLSHAKNPTTIRILLLIAAFEKYTKNFLFAKLREMSDLCKALPNQPGKELAEKKKALYIPLELCCF